MDSIRFDSILREQEVEYCTIEWKKDCWQLLSASQKANVAAFRNSVAERTLIAGRCLDCSGFQQVYVRIDASRNNHHWEILLSCLLLLLLLLLFCLLLVSSRGRLSCQLFACCTVRKIVRNAVRAKTNVVLILQST